MIKILRARLAVLYILIEILPTFLIGAFIFIFVLLMIQALRLTEFVLVHGVSILEVLKMMSYMTISFLPIILPMSILFAVLLTYGRLSGDSEIVALKSLGLNIGHLSLPALFLGLLIAGASAHSAYYLAPWGNRQFELMVNDLSKIKAAATIRDGTFSEGFFDMVIYANKVDSKNGQLSKVFIFDERDSESPLTIISKEGQIIQTKTSHGNSALLRLLDGDIHKANLNSYTKIKFHSYDINLFDPAQFEEKQKSLLSFNYDDLIQGMTISSNDPHQLRKIQIEFHRRAALAIACLLFSILGVGFGTITNRRSGKGGGFTLCLGLIVSYWILYVTCEGFAKSHLNIPTWSIIWFANFCFAGLALYSLKRASK